MTSYRFKECGLPNVTLTNGFTLEGDGEQQTVTIHALDSLHNAIGDTLTAASQYHPLKPAEVKFIRTELGLPQADLAHRLGVLDITAVAWELGNTMPHDAEALLRLLYQEACHGRVDVTEFLKEFAKRHDSIARLAAAPKLTFAYHDELGWSHTPPSA